MFSPWLRMGGHWCVNGENLHDQGVHIPRCCWNATSGTYENLAVAWHINNQNADTCFRSWVYWPPPWQHRTHSQGSDNENLLTDQNDCQFSHIMSFHEAVIRCRPRNPRQFVDENEKFRTNSLRDQRTDHQDRGPSGDPSVVVMGTIQESQADFAAAAKSWLAAYWWWRSLSTIHAAQW